MEARRGLDLPAHRRRIRSRLRTGHQRHQRFHRAVAVGADDRGRVGRHLLPEPGAEDPRRRRRLHRLDGHRLGWDGRVRGRALRRAPQRPEGPGLPAHHQRRARTQARRQAHQDRGRAGLRKEAVMAWIYLSVAIVFEIAFALGTNATKGFTRLWPSVFTLVSAAAGVFTLSLALKTLDV